MSSPAKLPTPSEVLPKPYTKVSFQSTAFPNVYLRSDAERKLINLQVGRLGWERHELIRQSEAEFGPDVFVVRSLHFPQHFLHIDPTVFPEQAPKPGTTFHPKGVGKSNIVDSIDQASMFKVVVNDMSDVDAPEGFHTISLKLIYTPPPGAPKSYYLRLNGNESDAFKGPGSGEVNAQTYIGPFERLHVERFAA
eukprot:TRINITY_DN99_c0_g2_i1.p1 TRINITY_DN99_c0_g2~~TRINITY_DN99_c0_g2_i1.p1  ORF type:complete len:219 (+),score=16.94 TRINITY_DN99_c0_g2_i1:77-658(+)